MKRDTRFWLASGLLAFSSLLASTAFAQLPMPPKPPGLPGLPGLPHISGVIEGAMSPGVYGRIDIGNSRPPPLIYAQPIIIQRPAVYVQQPLYLHVPPGHAKKWSKHCYKYDACGRQVYFVRVNGHDEYGRDSHKRHEYESRGHGKRDKKHGRDDDDGYGRSRGGDDDNSHGKGRGNGKRGRDD